jgi:hypothetical protein
MQVEHYYSDDYAGMESGRYKFYFGYEEQNANGEDLFVVKEHGDWVFSRTAAQIEKACKGHQFNLPQDYLVAGIGMWLLEEK